MVKEYNSKLRAEVLSLIKECRFSFHYFVSKGVLNSEGKKIQLQIIKKYIQFSNDKSILNFVKKNDEMSFIKMLNYVERILGEQLP